MTKEMKIVDVDETFAENVHIHRLADGGFQRKLRRDRLTEISTALNDGAICPPITIGKVGSKHILIDGQHRLEAWKLKPFPMKACIITLKDEDEAVESFVSMNREQKRVSLIHVLRVSNTEYAEQVRDLADRCKVTIPHIHNLMVSICMLPSGKLPQPDDKQWKLAAKIMSTWMAQKRWGRQENVFSVPGVLMLVGYFTAKASNPDSMLKDLLRFDYARQSAIGRMVGTSYGAQKKMKAYVYKALAEQVI
jgi:hypothetical protein